MIASAQSDSAWAVELTRHMPAKWQRRILNRFERTRGQGDGWSAQQESRIRANVEIRETVEGLGRVRIGLDAGDAHLCAEAERLAEHCMRRAELFHDIDVLHAAMVRIADGQGIAGPDAKHMTTAGKVARLTDALWWRRQLRKLHAKQVEGAAISLGYVNRSRECYVSDQSLDRRLAQNRRNAATLEATTATNEDGQEFTLAELAAKGPGNKAIRRAELMTRISGFERVAMDLGHAGLFFTMTCPSGMHKFKTVKGGGVIENKRYRGTTPREAQTYLGKVWARIRAALARAKVGIYGFRIAEPNHDGTPHWHLLVFHDPAHADKLRALVLKHALKDSPMEPGALEHRVDFKPIDAGKGTAAGYIAKYVAKNIDGYKLDADLYGNPALETSARVEAWATTWGIRQFQQVGGPPVGPWRELRRVRALPDGAPDHLADAWRAVNKLQVIEGRENASVAWDRYCRAQGGVFCGRKYRIKVATRTAEGTGRYGEPIGERPIGVSTTSFEYWTPPHMAHMGGRSERVIHWVCESVRFSWVINKRRSSNAAKKTVGGVMAQTLPAPTKAAWEVEVMAGEIARADSDAARVNGLWSHAPKAPWTRVNNCTEGGKNERKPSAGAHQSSDSNGINGMGTDPAPHQGHERRPGGAFAGCLAGGQP